jgi:hypothetical protein
MMDITNFLSLSREYDPRINAHSPKVISFFGRAVSEAVSRWFPTAAAPVRARSGHVGFVVAKVALRQVFSQYFGFPYQSSFQQILHPHNQTG